jgi:hypothetical protein
MCVANLPLVGSNSHDKRNPTTKGIVTMRTPSAQAATLIRKELKQAGIKASVTSKRYSGGSSITVRADALDSASSKALELNLKSKYCYGHFNGMDDCYEYTNRNELPKASYIFVNC